MNFISSGVPPKPALSSKCEALAIDQSSFKLIDHTISNYLSFAKTIKRK